MGRRAACRPAERPLGGLTALERHGLATWHRDEITVLVAEVPQPRADRRHPIRRDPPPDPAATAPLGRCPIWRIEPAALLFAGYEPVTRSAYGLLAAVRAAAADDAGPPRPLDRADASAPPRQAVPASARRARGRDAVHGRARHRPRCAGPTASHCPSDRSDAETRKDGCVSPTPSGGFPTAGSSILEVDGGFHMDVEHWSADMERERRPRRRRGHRRPLHRPPAP